MAKKKINKEDLELDFKILSSMESYNNRDASNNCGDATYNTCVTHFNTCVTKINSNCPTCNELTKAVTCDTTLTSIVDCKTKEDGDGCNTVNTLICETLNCAQSISNAQYCCPATKYEGCKQTYECATNATVCADSINLCAVTMNNCQETNDAPCYAQTRDDDCFLQPYTEAEDCEGSPTDFCILTLGVDCG